MPQPGDGRAGGRKKWSLGIPLAYLPFPKCHCQQIFLQTLKGTELQTSIPLTQIAVIGTYCPRGIK